MKSGRKEGVEGSLKEKSVMKGEEDKSIKSMRQIGEKIR
jgi:hypothetical protein